MSQLNVTELDFATIKENLKTFMQSQEEFQDYNFDGAGLTILLDILAYNTHYNATLAHLQANEMFIDSAVKRNSVTSIAKTLGYTPTSRRSARANITLQIRPPESFTNTSLTVTRDTPFTAKTAKNTYTFFPREDYVSGLVILETGQTGFSFPMELIEGKRVTNTFIVDQSNKSGPFVLPNGNIDTTTMRVRVQQSNAVTSITTWNFYDDIVAVDGNTRAFFIEEGPSGLYEVRFGDNIIGQELQVGNIVSIDYIVSSGAAANSIPNFSASRTFTASNESKVVYLGSAATGGTEKESVDSIRYNAPKFNSTKNRVVTSDDYETLIRSRFGNINSIAVWGGEENTPPIYGKVFISIQPRPGSIISQADKDIIARDIIRPRSVVSIQPEFVDPIETYIGLNITVNYNKTITSLTSSRIESEVRAIVQSFFTNNVNKLQKNFYYSKLLSAVVGTTQSIFSASIQVLMHKRIPIFAGVVPEDYVVRFNGPLEIETLKTSTFNTTIGAQEYVVYITDQHDTTVGDIGTLVMKRASDDVIVLSNVGTVDYATGVVNITNLFINSGTESTLDNTLRVYVEPFGDAPNILTTDLTSTSNISTAAVFPYAARNTVLTLDTSAPNSAVNIPAGLSVTAVANSQE
jgi:hypothetical protein